MRPPARRRAAKANRPSRCVAALCDARRMATETTYRCDSPGCSDEVGEDERLARGSGWCEAWVYPPGGGVEQLVACTPVHLVHAVAEALHVRAETLAFTVRIEPA